MATDKTAREQRGRPFKPGQSGNPGGRPKGSRSKVLLMLEALAEGEAEEIARVTIDKAKSGDAMAARAILDRVWPVRKGARIEFDLPDIAKAEDLPAAIASISRQMAEGAISPDEAAGIASFIEVQRKVIETNDLACRLAALEERLSSR